MSALSEGNGNSFYDLMAFSEVQPRRGFSISNELIARTNGFSLRLPGVEKYFATIATDVAWEA
jgi:hypothetical protein